MRYFLLAGAAVLSIFGAASAQTRTVDQSNPYVPPTTGMPFAVSVPVDRYSDFGQSFTPTLSSIDYTTFYLENQYGSQVLPEGGLPNVNSPPVPALYSVSLYRGTGTFNTTTLLATTGATLIPTSSGLSNPFFNAEFDFLTSVAVTTGQQYTLILNDLTRAANPTLYDDVSVQVSGDTYAGGKFTVANDGGDLVFSEGIFSPVAAVPEPATWAMMILGFGAIGFTMRRRKVATRISYIA